jgi:hypothetical protein
MCQNSASYKSIKKVEYCILYFIIYIFYKILYSTNMCITPVSSNSSNSSLESVISYYSNTIPNTNTCISTSINTLATSPLLLYSCKYCCSNYSQKIALVDYYLNNYELWL